MLNQIGTQIGRMITFAAVAVFAVGVFGQEFTIDRHTIDGGGVMRSTGGDFELSGTIGQPDAGVLQGDEFTLTGGFWFETPLGDCQEDGDVDLLDYDLFESCVAGPSGSAPTGICRCFDVDRSGRVDLIDYSIIQTTFTD